MRTPRITRPSHLVAVAAVMVATAAILLVAINQGSASAATGPPGPPGNPLAHLIVPDGEAPRIRVSWDAADTPATGYTISRSDGQSFETAGATTYSDHAVEPGESYSYTVAARNAQGASAASDTTSASVPPAPSMPGDFAGNIGELSAADEHPTISLTWAASTVPTAAACETSYPLQDYVVTRTSGDETTEVATPASGDTSFTDTTAAFATIYTYRITARSAIGSSPISEVSLAIPVRPVDPPTDVSTSIADPFDGTVSLSWNPPAEGPDITGYTVLRNGASIADGVAATTHADDTAQAGVAYSYTVQAHSADNVSAASDAAAIEAPAPPSDVTAAKSDQGVSLTWSAPTAGKVDQYRVERQPADQGWTSIADTTETSHSDATAQTGVSYRYRVQHRNQHGGSTWTESNRITLLAAPGAPTGVTATADGNDNVVTWTAPADSTVEGYRVRHHDGDGAWTTIADALTDTTHRHDDAAADVTHHYGVQAYNSAGDGPWSEDATTMRITPPAAPATVSAAVDGNDIVVTWERPDTVHIDGFTVGHRTDVNDQYTTSPQTPADATSYRIDDVTGDVTYHIAVKTHNQAGESAWSDETTTLRRIAPSMPTSVTATVGNDNIVVSWQAPETGTADGYRVEYRESGSETAQTVELAATATSYTHADTVEGTEYQYRVQAHNTAGASAWTDPVTARRLSIPAAPTGVTAKPSGSVIVVEWTPPENGIIDTYEVRYGIADGDSTQTVSIAAPANQFIHIEPTGDTRYRYDLRARNDAGDSAWSNVAYAMRVVPPPMPTNLSVVIHEEDLFVSWTAPSSGIVDSYEVELRQAEHVLWTRFEVANTSTTYTHDSPTPGTNYEYRVRAVNSGGVSDWTTPVSEVWFEGAAPPAVYKPQPLGKRLIIRWEPSTTEGVTGYELRIRVDGGEWEVTQLDADTRLRFDNWSSEDDLREYSMRAMIDDVAGSWSPIYEVVIAQPADVHNVRANTEGYNKVRLHWDIPDEGRPSIFAIEAKHGDGDFSQVGSVSGYETTFLTGAQPYETTYQYRVRGKNNVRIKGPVAADGTVSVTMPQEPVQYDTAVQRLRVTMEDSTTPVLTWNAPERHVDSTLGYRIFRKTTSDHRPIDHQNHILVTLTNKLTFTDRSARPGFTYLYAVTPYRSLTPALGTTSPPLTVRTW